MRRLKNISKMGWLTTDDVPVWKAPLDYVCIFLALPVLLPLFAFLSVYIKLISPGPVFFRQTRVGYKGRQFLCFKFRTMKMGADTGVHQNHFKDLVSGNKPMVKMDAKGDSRLIPFGGVIRASGLDELPQLINVLRRDMSLVGPRPCTPFEYELYVPWQKERFRAVPGLSGLWQVSGKNKTTFNEMINMDIYYAHNQSLWMDARIIYRTFATLAEQIQEIRQAKKKTRNGSPVDSKVAITAKC